MSGVYISPITHRAFSQQGKAKAPVQNHRDDFDSNLTIFERSLGLNEFATELATLAESPSPGSSPSFTIFITELTPRHKL